MRISSKVFSADYNDTTIIMEEPVVTASATITAVLKLASGFSDDLNLSNINNNPDFLGQLKGFKTFSEDSNRVKLQLSVGDYMYEGIVEELTILWIQKSLCNQIKILEVTSQFL
ncbi:MAG: hypothetical protein MTP17_01440 [Candidatus Midichloria sp.]|nr:MAG: hypothetical protein MTP17_01440 [Candidatus Midichloria sp.]